MGGSLGDWEGNVWVIPVNRKLLAVILVIQQWVGVIQQWVGSFSSGWGHSAVGGVIQQWVGSFSSGWGHSAVGGVILVIGKVWENSDDWEVFGSFRYLGSGWGHYGDWKGVDKFR